MLALAERDSTVGSHHFERTVAVQETAIEDRDARLAGWHQLTIDGHHTFKHGLTPIAGLARAAVL
jgi:hypothetical protein